MVPAVKQKGDDPITFVAALFLTGLAVAAAVLLVRRARRRPLMLKETKS
ncbi:MAG TPA: hypothetical protein VGG32_01215 [Thermoplasmata archaeon]|jgi:hypothetical protein